MPHVPSDAEIDAMDEDQLQSFLETGTVADPEPGTDSGSRASGTPASGPFALSGAPRAYGLGLVLAAVVGLGSCWELMLAELQELREPDAVLVCDINPFISCGASLDIWQGNILGVPNSFIGAMGFAALGVTGVLLASGGRLPRWYWWAMTAAVTGAMAFIVWFLGVSILTLGKLCPFCMLIWAVVIPVFTHTVARAADGGHLGLSRRAVSRLVAARWWAAAALYLAVVVAVLVAFWDEWMALL